jgi:hypothetical protein
VCVPEGDRVGALVPKSSACPAHFDGTKTLLHQGLQDDGCTGCSCTADTNCVSDVFYFPDDASCTSATFPYGAAYYIGTVGIAVCDAQHLTMNPLTTNFASPAGWAAGKFRATDSCQAMGTAEPVVPSWSKSDNFCETSLLGGGCDSGEVCVPKPAGVPVCASRNGGGSCGGSTAADTWYTGFDDKRTCDACACDTSGSDCTSLTLKMGHDYGCGTTDSTLGSEEKACMISTYDPPVYLDGTFTAAKCSAHADATGSLDPTGRLNLCCVQ